jgi:hypothetical protein
VKRLEETLELWAACRALVDEPIREFREPSFIDLPRVGAQAAVADLNWPRLPAVTGLSVTWWQVSTGQSVTSTWRSSERNKPGR